MTERQIPILSTDEIKKLEGSEHISMCKSALKFVTGGVLASTIPLRLVSLESIQSASYRSGEYLSGVYPGINPELTSALIGLGIIAGTVFGGISLASSALTSTEYNAIYQRRKGAIALNSTLDFKAPFFNDEEKERLGRNICMLPPVGAKIAVPESGVDGFVLLPPCLLAEQLVPDLIRESQRIRTKSDFLVQQLTVQGRAGDEFKLVPILMLMHSDNLYDWDQPGFQAAWGKYVPPMIHDGGKVEYGLNPIWGKTFGRTDFLSRVVFADEIKQDENRLMVDAKAFQRLKLAYDCAYYSHPFFYEDEVKKAASLAETWRSFRIQTRVFIKKCGLKELLDTRWLHISPRQIPGMWGYGTRFEADLETVKPGLLKLNQVMEMFPEETQAGARKLLVNYTNRVDQIVGIS